MKRFVVFILTLIVCFSFLFTISDAINRVVPDSRYVSQIDSITVRVHCDSIVNRGYKPKSTNYNVVREDKYLVYVKEDAVDTSGYTLKIKYYSILGADTLGGFVTGTLGLYNSGLDSLLRTDSLICKNRYYNEPDSSYVLQLAIPREVAFFDVRGEITKTIVAGDSLFKVKVGVR